MMSMQEPEHVELLRETLRRFMVLNVASAARWSWRRWCGRTGSVDQGTLPA
jgi:hypothetical protein